MVLNKKAKTDWMLFWINDNHSGLAFCLTPSVSVILLQFCFIWAKVSCYVHSNCIKPRGFVLLCHGLRFSNSLNEFHSEYCTVSGKLHLSHPLVSEPTDHSQWGGIKKETEQEGMVCVFQRLNKVWSRGSSRREPCI